MILSSRASEGHPKHCSWCGADLKPEAAAAPGEAAPCPRCGNHLWFTWEDRDEVLAIKPTGKKLELPSIAGPVVPVPKPVLIDLSEVSTIVSADLAKLLKLKMQLAAAGGKLTLSNIHPNLLKVFRTARLDSVFTIEA